MATLDNQYTTDSGDYGFIYGNSWSAQRFTSNYNGKFYSVDLKMRKVGTPGADLTVTLNNISAGLPGSVIETVTVPASSIGTSDAWVSIAFAGTSSLVSGTSYFIVIHSSGGNSSNGYRIRGGTVASGGGYDSGNAGASWSGNNYSYDYKQYVNTSTTYTQTITSDAKVIAVTQQTITSDARIFANDTQRTITSDARIHVTGVQQTILSDAKIALESLYNVNNKFNIVKLVLADIASKFNSALRVFTNINNFVNTVKSGLENIANDIRTLGSGLYDVSNDIRFLLDFQVPGVAGVQSLGKSYIRVYFDGVEQTDVDVDSIEIHKVLNNSHTASLDLARAYDVNVPTAETVVTIYYNTWLLYKGYITEVNPAESPETINIVCNDKYWYNNRTDSYFFVGHEPLENRAPNVVETYYATPKTALLSEFSFSVDIGNFVPQTISCFGVGASDAISSLINECGNYAWFYDVDDTKKLWSAEEGSIINIDRQVLGANIGLYKLLNHQFKKDASNIVNKYRVQMGNITYAGSREYAAYQYTSYVHFLEPAWDRDYEILAKDSVSGEGWDSHSAENAYLYADVFKKYTLPYLDPKISQYSDRYPPYVNIYNIGNAFGFVGELNLSLEATIREGFTIDYENKTVTFSEPLFLYQSNSYGEYEAVRAPIVKIFIWKKDLISYTDDTDNNPLVFYTSKVGSYPTTITKELNLSDLSKSTGVIYKAYQGVNYQIPQFDDTDFANDYALWQLSKTAIEKITGNVELTLDTICYYNIDLAKRIFINGITSEAMNIISMDYRISDFTVSIQLENSQGYRRLISLPWHGE